MDQEMKANDIRELALDEMDKVSGGSNWGEWEQKLKGAACKYPRCRNNNPDTLELIGVENGIATLKCGICGFSFTVRV